MIFGCAAIPNEPSARAVVTESERSLLARFRAQKTQAVTGSALALIPYSVGSVAGVGGRAQNAGIRRGMPARVWPRRSG